MFIFLNKNLNQPMDYTIHFAFGLGPFMAQSWWSLGLSEYMAGDPYINFSGIGVWCDVLFSLSVARAHFFL